MKLCFFFKSEKFSIHGKKYKWTAELKFFEDDAKYITCQIQELQ